MCGCVCVGVPYKEPEGSRVPVAEHGPGGGGHGPRPSPLGLAEAGRRGGPALPRPRGTRPALSRSQYIFYLFIIFASEACKVL